MVEWGTVDPSMRVRFPLTALSKREVKNMNAQQIESAVRMTKEKCLFAEEFAVGVSVRTEPIDKKATRVRKEGIIKIFFLDSATQQVVSEIALTSITAKTLANTLMKNVSNLEKDLASNKPRKSVEVAKPHYTG